MTEPSMDFTRDPAKTAFAVAGELRVKGHQAYFAGGCVRDFLMGQVPQDFDIATSALPEQVEKIFSHTVPVGKQFGVILVLAEGRPFEVATFRREGGYQDGRHPGEVRFTGPEEDARRRDFTINGLFYDPFEAKVIDFVGGLPDLKKKMIRAIGNPCERFDEDKLRLLRAVRFAATLCFEIHEATWRALRDKAPEIHAVSPERIRDEIVKILVRPHAGRGLDLLAQSGLLKEILPEVEAMKGVPQPPQFHPEGDVFVHTRLLLEKLESPTPTLALAALLHDVGKPKTLVRKQGRLLFYEHAPVGARMAKAIMKRLRFSNEEIDKVFSTVENHMKVADVKKMREGKLRQFVSRPNFSEELELHRIDCLASHGMLDNYDFLQKKLADYAKEELRPKPMINGYDLMALGMKPGPAMKPLLEEIYTRQLEGGFEAKDQALQWAARSLSKRPGKKRRRMPEPSGSKKGARGGRAAKIKKKAAKKHSGG